MLSLNRLALALLAASFTASTALAATCEDLASLKLPQTTISTAAAVPAGDFQPPEGPVQKNLPAFCRVAGSIQPAPDSNIQFEVWMPASGWNGKFYGAGNGGFAGSITYQGLGTAVAHGYAAASTDTGHHGGATDASWALDHPQKIVDFGYRAIHETTDKAKAILAAFYGNSPKRSYFSSCSNGGRQALMEAQRYPADYDGIIAGSPAYDWTHLLTMAVADVNVLQGASGTYIPASKIPAIEGAALAACDAADGVKDGLISDPSQCHFDPSVLLCKGDESDQCLTQPQVAALKKLYEGPRDSSGKLVYPGFSPGGESGGGGWPTWITGRAPGTSLMFLFGTGFYKNMVYDNATWDFKTFNTDQGLKMANDKQARDLNATDTDLKKFHDRGGKLIIYHGWSDAAIPPQGAIDYYKAVTAKMGAKNTAAFIRLYMVPGMQHCGGGPGPNAFGQAGVPLTDPQHDIAAALEQWVEAGTAPEQVIATKFQSGVNPASGVARTRPLCPYPQVAKYKGSGSIDDAANFTCMK